MRLLVIAAFLGFLALPGVASGQAAPRGDREIGRSQEEILGALLGTRRRIKVVGAGDDRRGRIAVPIHFARDSAEITPDSFLQLRRIGTALRDKRLRSARILIEGHTDYTGPESYNQWLSERRARAVKRYLVSNLGVAAARLVTVGYGESRPLPGVSQRSAEGRARNRRVELVNLAIAGRPAKASREREGGSDGGDLPYPSTR